MSKLKENIKNIMEFAREGRLEDWIDSFLRTEGKNVALADGLKKTKRYWTGPIEFPINNLLRCCGPEENMEYKVSLDHWNIKTESLIKFIKSDGELAPLIAQYKNGIFSLRDGNHRHEAYKKLDYETCWTLIWCDSKEEFEKMKKSFNH